MKKTRGYKNWMKRRIRLPEAKTEARTGYPVAVMSDRKYVMRSDGWRRV